jgi:hypothetical protein
MDKRKYEREIEEILRKAEEDGWASKSGAGPGKTNPPDNIKRPRPANKPTGFRLTPGLILGISIAVVVLIFLIRPFAPVVSAFLTPLAVLFFLGALFYYYTTSSSGGRIEKRWRGQAIDVSNPDDPFAGLKRTLNRWFGRR